MSGPLTLPRRPTVEPSLDDLPVKDGFRLRGLEMTRIETFTDAAFAFALTLLMLTATPPDTIDKLKDLIRDVPVFVFGAANLMVFWNGHNEWSRRYGLDDFRTLILSVALVSTLLMYVYPLKYVGNLFVNFIGHLVHVPIGHPPEAGFQVGDVNTAFIIYGAGFVANGIVLILLNAHAWSRREALQLNQDERFATKAEIGAWTILCVVGLLSIVVGALLPNVPGSPGMTYMLLGIVMPIYGAAMTRKRKALPKDPSYRDVVQVLSGRD